MYTVITIVHVLACIFLVLVVLLQTGKGAEMGAVFGGSSSTVFGSSGAGTFLSRLTTATAIIFMLTSLSLTYFSARRNSATVFDTMPVAAPQEAEPGAPAAPEAGGAPPEAAAPAAPEAAAPAPAGHQAAAPAEPAPDAAN
jgi:preprotein translocase subunit SecG